MITDQLINPGSIVVIGASNDIRKPGGKVLKNLLDGGFAGKILVTNLKESNVQGIKSYRSATDLPQVDLAIIAIAAKYVPGTVKILAHQKQTRAFIILSAGFGEEDAEGAMLEKEIVDTINATGGCLIGPNCIGVLTPAYHGVFTMPVPRLDPRGCDFISGSGATACFIMEAGIPKGLPFARVFSVGNSAQLGVEEILQYMDETFDPETSPGVKLLYIENIKKPHLLFKHSASLIRKGCRIAAIKAGTSEAGSRAASSHTGALATSDTAVDALFRKAGIIRCHGREEMISVASVFMHKPMKGKRMAIISHAGGPAVMLTDVLSDNGMQVPPIRGKAADELLEKLFPGSSVANPIDFLATGTAEQLGTIIDYADEKFDNIDGMTVIFGTPGLFDIFDVYDILDSKMNTSQKPIFPVLPSTLTAKEEVESFIAKGRVFFPDEVVFGKALTRIMNTPPPEPARPELPEIDKKTIRNIIDSCDEGYISAKNIQKILDASGIPRIEEYIAKNREEAVSLSEQARFPVVMKVVGQLHKSDVGGVRLNIPDASMAAKTFDELMGIKGTTGVLIQPMIHGIELFAGATYEDTFGHLVLCGLGGIFIEVLKDVRTGLAPFPVSKALEMIKNLKSYKIIQGIRGQEGVDEQVFAEIISRLSALVVCAPEIVELDLNPLIGKKEKIRAVDARIRIKRQKMNAGNPVKDCG